MSYNVEFAQCAEMRTCRVDINDPTVQENY